MIILFVFYALFRYILEITIRYMSSSYLISLSRGTNEGNNITDSD